MLDKNKPFLVVLSGAGISAESGLATFRDSGGLWEGYKIEDVATPEAWIKDPVKVLEFYNLRRISAQNAFPNFAHTGLADLEEFYNVQIITQNVDDLHERAGSTKVLHLHGELNKSRSTKNPRLIYPINGPYLNYGDKCELGSQLRPHIVWFGESVPLIETASNLVQQADVFLVIGTSLQVYPAAGLLSYFDALKPMYFIDPNPMKMTNYPNINYINKHAVEGMKKFMQIMLKKRS